ncbi:MAG: hypothetical protein AAF721_34610 [Myxococcota bacterium]
MERARGPEHRDLAVLFNNLGYVRLELGDSEAAYGAFARSLRIYDANDARNSAQTFPTELGLAIAARRRKRYEEAGVLYEALLLRVRTGDAAALHDPTDVFEGAAKTYDALGNSERAAALRREAQDHAD